ncbi:MAG: recombinase family protein [Oligoflexia bacterium]|nr:recombinase family protein [Oligoflexia bacterium]
MKKPEWMGNNNRTIATIRRSGAGQKDNTSAQVQIDEIKRYCEEYNLNIIKIFDFIETASKREKRKYYREVDTWAVANNILHRVFYKGDRETRNLTDNENAEADVKSGKYVLHYALERKVYHQNSPDIDFLMRDYNAVNNKHYCRDLGTKISNATRKKAEMGWTPITVPPWGYLQQKQKTEKGFEKRRGTIVAIDKNGWKTKAVIREFELRASKKEDDSNWIMSLEEIRKQIIKEGLIPYDQIKRYNKSSIEKRLKNIFYDGRFMWDGVEYNGNHERIISKELFWKVQDTFGLRNKYRKKSDGVFGGGWLKCADPDCGCFVCYDPKTKIIKATGETKTYKYYNCTNGKKIHKGRVNVSEDSIWRQFETIFDQLDLPVALAEKIAAALNQGIVKMKQDKKREVESLAIINQKLEEDKVELYKDLKRGIIDERFYKTQYAIIEKELLENEKILETSSLADGFNEFEETVKSTFELAKNAKLLWNQRGSEEKKILLDKLLSNRALDGVTVQYSLKKVFELVVKMKENGQNPKWRRLSSQYRTFFIQNQHFSLNKIDRLKTA